jgi:Zn-dependent peptidase ImmA (M78 family)
MPSTTASEVRAQRAEIRRAALALLRECGISEPAVPTDTLLAFSKLDTETFAYSDMIPAPRPGQRESAKLAAKRARLAHMDIDVKVRGILDTQDNIVLTHNTLSPDQRRFCTFHELGHFTLTWHRELFYQCSELDMSPEALATLEQDANWFAIECAFLGDRFEREVADYRPSISNIRKLTKIYKTSFEATARHYVESQAAPVALLVVAPRPDLGSSIDAGQPLLAVRYAVASPAMKRLGGGYLARGTLIPWRHPATELYLSRSNHQASAPDILTFAPNNSQLACETEIYYNGYNVFILAWPSRRW